MNAKERVMAVINHEKPDRMPCFGANSTVTYEQMEKVGAFWPEGHDKAEAMAKQALAAYTVLGFDAVRLPFCQTFEAVALGCIRKPGKVRELEGFPGIEHPPPYKLDDTPEFPDDFLSRGYIPELIKAVEILKKEVGDEVPIVAGIIGPFTIAGSLLDSVPILKATFKTPDKLPPFLELGEKAGTTLAKALVEAGADIISCEDMTASPELIAPKTYREFEMEYQRRQFEAIPVPTILHICGNVDPIVEWMGQTGADILSLEPKASARLARQKCGSDIILMGGVDTATTLFMKDPETVREGCEETIEDGIQILAPGCAVAPGTPMENLLAMVEVAKAH
ncbi:MAG: MtaA/CmuA family methyltransferase [Desulfobacterales bacterium]|jgi:[methyl-Co(III) methanol-specific corrinoid protein]:coenzyme M methyltransferase